MVFDDVIRVGSKLVGHALLFAMLAAIAIMAISPLVGVSHAASMTATAVISSAASTPLQIVLTPNSASINTGQSIAFTNTTVGGISPYTFTYLVLQSGVPATGTYTQVGNTITFTGTGTYDVSEQVADSTPSNTAASNNAVITVTAAVLPAIITGGGGGIGGSGGTGAGGGGSFLPTILASTSTGQVCSTISNFTQHNNETVSVLNTTFKVTENYITPTTAGITIGNNAYELLLDDAVPIGTMNGVNYTVELTTLSYLPIIDTVSVAICGALPAPAVPAYTQINVTTNNSSYTGTFILSIYRTLNLRVNGLGFSGTVTSDSSTNQTETVTVTKYMGGPAITGYYELNGFNITISPDIYTTAHVVLSYACNSGATGVVTYQLVNGAWVTPTGASLNAATCQLSWTTDGAKTTIGVFAVVQPTTTVAASGSSAP